MDRQETMALIEEICEKAGRHKKLLMWIIIVFAVVLLLVRIASFLKYQVFTYPVNQVSQYGITNATEKANLINQYRTTSIQYIATLAQIVGGGAVLTGIYFAWENLITSREGQITERFTRAVDQLGSEKLEIRLGGIYALERIANESKKDYWPIMEILTAYIRQNSPNIEIENIDIHGILKQKKLSLDIQAILTVIKRRKNPFNDKESNSLDLSSSYLGWSSLRKVNLAGVNLQWANLYGSGLQGANFERAILEEVIFEDANLKGTNFQGAKLRSADFKKASLIEVVFKEADLVGADFTEADLQEANFEMTFLGGSNFKGAKNLTVEQLSKAKTLYNAAELDEELLIPLKEAHSTLFEKPDYNE
jgi:uncharacterized protein YjbI with pentapeptide repeats